MPSRLTTTVTGPGRPLRQAGSCAPRPAARRRAVRRRTWRSARDQAMPTITSPASGSGRPRASLPSPGTRAWTIPSRTQIRPRQPCQSPVSPPPAPPPLRPWHGRRPPRRRRPRHSCRPRRRRRRRPPDPAPRATGTPRVTGTDQRPQAPAPPGGPSWRLSRWSARPGRCGAGPAGRASRRGPLARGRGRRQPACPHGRRPSACGASRRSRGSNTRPTAFTSRTRPPRAASSTPSPARGRGSRAGIRQRRPSQHRRSQHRSSRHGRSKDGRSKDGRSRDGRPSNLGRRSSRRPGHRSGSPRVGP